MTFEGAVGSIAIGSKGLVHGTVMAPGAVAIFFSRTLFFLLRMDGVEVVRAKIGFVGPGAGPCWRVRENKETDCS